MSNTLHTPGPWYYNRDEGGTIGHNISGGGNEEKDPHIIAYLDDEQAEENPNAEHDMRLIAAAPALYAALAKLVALADDPCSAPDDLTTMAALIDARNALDAAEGMQHLSWLNKHVQAQAGQRKALDRLAGGDAARLCEEVTEQEEA